MRKISSLDSLYSCCLAFFILIGFLHFYPIPPLADFQAHVVFGMLKLKGTLGQYYEYRFSLTYRLLDDIIRFWAMLFQKNYAHIALYSYLTILFFIASTIYSFCILLKLSYQRAFCVTAVVFGPAFLLLHSLSFYWGLIPFTLAAFSAIPSATALWCLDDEIIHFEKNHRKTLTIFLVYTFFTIYSHPFGFIFLAIAWMPSVLRLFFIRKPSLKRQSFWIILFCGIFCFSFIVISLGNPLGHRNSLGNLIFQLKISSIPCSDLSKRLHWLITGGPYKVFKFLFLSTELEAGLLRFQALHVIQSLIPIVTFFFLFFLMLKKEKNLVILLTVELFLAFAIVIFIPKYLGQIGHANYRCWLYLSAWTFVSLAFIMNRCSEKIFNFLCLSSPLLMAFSCYLLMPLYAEFQETPLSMVAKHYTPILIKEVKAYRQSHPEVAHDIVIIDDRFHPHTIGKPWLHYYLVPFFMLPSSDLTRENIIIREDWYNDAHLPIGWKSPPMIMRQITYLHWGKETPNTIMLESCHLDSHQDSCLPDWVKVKNILDNLLTQYAKTDRKSVV